MIFTKRVLLYLFVCLCIMSIYKDLQKDIPQYDHKHSLKVNANKSDYRIAKVKLKHDDTFLSVVEKLHEEKIDEMNISKMMQDFKSLNPNVNPFYLERNTSYLFPLY